MASKVIPCPHPKPKDKPRQKVCKVCQKARKAAYDRIYHYGPRRKRKALKG